MATGTTRNGEMNGEGDRLTLTLKSPVGKEAKVYNWPLKKGRGSLRRSEDKQDEAAEIIETIRWVCEDCKEIKQALDSSGLLAASRYDPTSFESMNAICSAYNKEVDKLVTREKGTSKQEKRWGRVSRPHLKHILQKCYNKSVVDPNELNNYEAFTPEVYGETSFELICQILDRLYPIKSDNRFVDLGSGVGQVVLQVAALTDCQISLGIEKATTPARYAQDMRKWFEFWMAFYGKVYSDFKLCTGDFLDQDKRPEILASTIVFVNNFAFGPEVDQHLKDIFADLADGARIFSSKSFCALNFRITDRNLTDIGTIMHVSQMDPLKGSVSWTGNSVSYYLHLIDRAKLERYFQKTAARKDDQDKRGKRGRGHPSHKDHLGIDESSSGSREDSRASSIEKDVTSLSISEQSNSVPPTPTSGSGKQKWVASDDDTHSSSPPGGSTPTHNSLRKAKQMPGRNGRKSVTTKTARKLGKRVGSFDDLINPETGAIGGEGEVASTPPVTGSNSSTPPPPSASGDSNGRPVRSVVENSSISNKGSAEKPVAKKRGRKPNSDPKKRGIRTKHGAPSAKIAKISGLDLLHQTMMDSINASTADVSAPQGCVNERLTSNAPKELLHEELPLSMNVNEDGVTQLPFQLQLHLEKCKRQYLSFMRHMQDPVFRAQIESDIEKERKKNSELVKREKQLRAQIENLITDSLQLLKCRLNELGIQAKSPPEFIEKAKGIVCNHHDLQRDKSALDKEVEALEAEQEKIIAAKEKELFETMLKTGVSPSEARQIVKKQIDNAVNGLAALASGTAPTGDSRLATPLLNKLSDVTLTRCGSDQLPSSTQIRKRPRDKQKDWPEKRHKPTVTNSKDVWQIEPKLEDNAPEVLAKKIIEQGRSAEKKVGSLSVAPSPVEVRKLDVELHHPLAPPPPPPQGATRAMQPPPAPPPTSLPKIDLSAALSNAGRMEASELILPPHPDSRSSDQTAEDMSFASNKVNSTPRAEQFEDRLKTIIHSVLTGDEQHQQVKQQQDVKPPLHVMPPKSPTQSSKPMFSPVKKELPTHLPLPPSGVVGPSYSGAISPPPQKPPSPMKRGVPPGHPPYFHRQQRMGDIISSELEKDMRIEEYQRMSGGMPTIPKAAHSTPVMASRMPPSAPPSAPPNANGGSSNGSGMARMSQVIEDSIRGHVIEANSREHPKPKIPRSHSTDREDELRRFNGGEDYRGYIDRREQPPYAGSQRPMLPPRRGYPDLPTGSGGPWGHVAAPPPPPEAHSSSSSDVRYPPSPHHRYSSYPSHMNHPPPSQTSPRKRQMSPPPGTVHLPPKKQHMEVAPMGGDYNRQNPRDFRQSYYPDKKPSMLPQMSLNFPTDMGLEIPSAATTQPTSFDGSNDHRTDYVTSPHSPPSHQRYYHPKFHYNQRPRSPSPQFPQ